ncbi:fumarylacetoacetate hydrolase family protein [Microbacterium ulmi]|uniref:Fumarylacetoacetate hydrolase family protein n=1 Tax=Microbacterium ulmi TaxID=179095 RepID=A0A7Y2M012_9MICO|nr:fumarylacetoacetate hydrolase family protein [Microbacterium ulmi]NII68967.1 2-keto-4-pentenoate hydratase/2-oxohepta-3-ene-1,7-dioic acid hydratase in catechol pathway [Microbacterium ulmi]NNH03950.1 fumarylacetoacetate hydrolase family protein [Microbacterium ulmi]
MKLGRISSATPDGPDERIVAVDLAGDRVVDLARAFALVQRRRGAWDAGARRLARAVFPSSMSAAIAAGPLFLDAAHVALAAADDASIPLDAVDWVAPLDPPMIRDGLTFQDHIVNYSRRAANALPNPSIYRMPGYFKGSTGSIYGPGAEVPYPSFSSWIDYELEIGYVIGKPGSDLTPDESFDHIFGVTIFNDFSARDVQLVEIAIGMGPQHGKDFAFGIGPWITTMDEIGSIEGLTGSVRINGEVWSQCRAENMVWSPAELVAYVSVADSLQPGDLIASGTMGNGSSIELGRELSPGDVVELTLEGVGTLRHTMSAEKKAYPWWPEPKPYPFADAGAAG